LSSEITSTGVPTLWYEGKGHIAGGVRREPSADAAESETLSMCGNSMRENRETPGTPAPGVGAGRPEKVASRTSGRYVPGESDDLIVPTKRANNAGPSAAAESVEGRRSTKGKVFVAGRAPDTAPDQRVDRLEGVQAAFTSACASATRGKSRMK
jgi:hypothetical protein